MAYKIYSVESRKGGVGKTTIALNLSKALIDKGYDVLLIDCDITGTSVTEAAGASPFWQNVIDIVKVKDRPCNLLEYFETIYLKGCNIKHDLVDNIQLSKDKIHLIGSEIYGKDGNLIVDPRLLMDDLHSYWLVRLLETIAEEYSNKLNSEKTAIVLDNSPGYVGIGKSIREWLTSLGYDYAQFLLISSLDQQDVESTISSALEIEREMIGKWDVAYLYDLVTRHNGDFEELQKLLDERPSLKEFYYSLKDKPYKNNLEARPEANDFISVVLNKVPDMYRDNHLGYKFDSGGSTDRERVLKKLFPTNNLGFPINIIEYDASISGQFIEANMTSIESDEKQQKQLDTAFNNFNKRKGNYVESSDKVKQISSLIGSFKTLNNNLQKLGYGPMVRSLGSGFTSDQFIVDMMNHISGLGNVVIPQIDSLEFDNDELYNSDKELLAQMISQNNLVDYSSALYSLFEFVYKRVGISNKNSNKYLVVSLSLLFKAFMGIQNRQCKELGDYHLVLMKGFTDKSVSKEFLEAIPGKNIPLKGDTKVVFDSAVTDLFKKNFVRFYQLLCYVLLRMIDCADDYGIVAQAYRTAIIKKGRTLGVDLRQYLQAVVLKKTEIFDREKFEEIGEKPFEMQNVRDMLNKLVLNKE